MLFSRNPISGVVEVYTDEGEYVGKIGMMGDEPLDDKSEDEITTDGGPGSGNFGHKGRPGEVGWLGKGGAVVAGIGDRHGNLKEPIEIIVEGEIPEEALKALFGEDEEQEDGVIH